ncbi:MAG: transcriptional regulator NrdR [Lachnospiraceae bacterium]|nr:transcriptional regulator NrdR [Lachnospiraceae bacterium]
MKCPFCGYADTKVIDSRAQNDNSAIKRRRLCENCGKRFTTYEKIDIIPMSVIKRDGTRETFDKDKLINGIMKSCNKRPISISQIEGIADDVENSIMNTLEKEIKSSEIGSMVMDRLKTLDEVAYVRFASVYRQFKDVNTFLDELTKLIHEKKDNE